MSKNDELLHELNTLYAAHINHHVHFPDTISGWSLGQEHHSERAAVLKTAINLLLSGKVTVDQDVMSFVAAVEMDGMEALFSLVPA